MDMLMFLLQSLVAAFFAFRMFDTFSINGDGFTYHSLGIEHIGKWSDVKDIDERENFLVDLVRLEGILILKEKLNMKRNWLWLGKAKYFFIPVSQFSTKWRDSELGYRIKEYLPQIEWKKT